jgi:hypothetical protein
MTARKCFLDFGPGFISRSLYDESEWLSKSRSRRKLKSKHRPAGLQGEPEKDLILSNEKRAADRRPLRFSKLPMTNRSLR